MYRPGPVDIMHTHIPGVGVVRGENTWSNGGNFSGADCAVQGVLCTNFSWAGRWGLDSRRWFLGRVRQRVCVRGGMDRESRRGM
jgi:hypothetical protein